MKLNGTIYTTVMNCLTNKIRVSVLLVLIFAFASSSSGENTHEDNAYEFLKREYSLTKPYQGKRLFLFAQLRYRSPAKSGTCFSKVN